MQIHHLKILTIINYTHFEPWILEKLLWFGQIIKFCYILLFWIIEIALIFLNWNFYDQSISDKLIYVFMLNLKFR
jgi:hypothetical protein